MNQQDREMGLLAKATLRVNPGLGRIPKCDRGLAANEKGMTLITLDNGKVVRCWGNQKALQNLAVARSHRANVAKVEYIVADFFTKETLRVLNTFTVERVGNNWELVRS